MADQLSLSRAVLSLPPSLLSRLCMHGRSAADQEQRDPRQSREERSAGEERDGGSALDVRPKFRPAAEGLRTGRWYVSSESCVLYVCAILLQRLVQAKSRARGGGRRKAVKFLPSPPIPPSIITFLRLLITILSTSRKSKGCRSETGWWSEPSQTFLYIPRRRERASKRRGTP